MKKFFLRFLSFAVLLWLMDIGISAGLRQFRPIDYRQFLEAKQSFFEQTQDIQLLIIGDSHVADALHPDVIESEGGMRAFNLGVYHASPYEWYHLLLSSLRASGEKPKWLVLGTNPDMFSRPTEVGKYTPLIINDFETQYELYLNSSTGIDKKFFVKTLREDYLFEAVVSSLSGKEYKPTRHVSHISNGYLETTNQMEGVKWSEVSLKERTYNEAQVEYLRKTIELAQAEDIKVVMVNPPIWRESLDARRQNERFILSKRVIDSLASAYELPVFNQEYSVALEQSEFLNADHLNGFGAKKFSLEFARWVKSIENVHQTTTNHAF